MPNIHTSYWTFLPDQETTYQIGFAIGEAILADPTYPQLIAAHGNLGAGKTSLAQGIARGVGVPQSAYVNSPTFAIHQTHPIPNQLRVKHFHHFDLYRLEDEEDLIHLGLEEVIEFGVSFIEWPQRAPHFFAAHNHLQAHLFHIDEWVHRDFSTFSDGRVLMLTAQREYLTQMLVKLPFKFNLK